MAVFPLTIRCARPRPPHTRNAPGSTSATSDATLILTRGAPAGGTAFTIACAKRLGRPCLLVDLTSPHLDAVRGWLRDHAVRVLNVAGPRESSAPGIAAEAAAVLRAVLQDEAPPP